jgi:hypothetical protein
MCSQYIEIGGRGRKSGEWFLGLGGRDPQLYESTKRGDHDSSLCLLKMMVENDLIEFRCN